VFENISDTFGTWTRSTCMCDSDVENNLLIQVIFLKGYIVLELCQLYEKL
jgi:hypothetical protein